MSDEMKGPEEPANTVPQQEDAARKASTPKTAMNPVVAMGLLIVALLVVLLVVNGRSRRSGSDGGDARLLSAKAEAEALRSELNRQRLAMGLSPLAGGAEPIEETASRLKKDADTLVALAGHFDQLLSQRESEITSKNAEIIRSEQSRQALVEEIARLKGDLQQALVHGSEAETFRSQVANLQLQREALREELAQVRKELAQAGEAASAEEFAALDRRLEETLKAKEFFEQRAKNLEAELARLRLFASSEDQLIPAALELFRGLRQLEGTPDSENTKAYSELGARLGANVVQTLTFATGSSDLSPEDDSAVRLLVPDVPEGDLLLVVGYASKTGDVEANRKLSSDRATAVAQLIASVKTLDQLVQAVYLGQTDRFSGRVPERNQLCEIWHIRKP